METDIIGGFPLADANCKGCGRPLAIDNAWMTDGCPCNHVLGVNSMNETRWRLLMQLQQRQQHDIEKAKADLLYKQTPEVAVPEITRLRRNVELLRALLADLAQASEAPCNPS